MLFTSIRRILKRITEQDDNTDEVMHIQCELFSRKGIDKETNEDSFLIDRYEDSSESKATHSLVSDRMHVFAIFDGVSAGGNGKRSSEMAVQCLQAVLNDNMSGFDDSFIASMDAAIKSINLSIHRAFSEQPGSKWGTTMAMIILYRSDCIVYNVGDSRVYRLTDGSLIQLSYDHTLENYKRQLGFLKKDPYISEIDGSTLYQCLGKGESLEYYRYGPFRYKADDKFFICSDGISGYLDRNNLVSLLQSDQDKTVINLAEAARKAGSMDDQTGILISVG